MAISKMAKVMIISHRTEAAGLLEALQQKGICQILNAEQAMVSKDFPELGATAERPKDLEELLVRLAKSIAFLKNYAEAKKSLADALSPRTVVDQQAYNKVVSDRDVLKIIDQCQQIETAIEKLRNHSESLSNTLAELRPWQALKTPVEEIGRLQQTTCLAGLLPAQYLERIEQQTSELAAVIQQVGAVDNKKACLVACLNENLAEVQKLLRAADFEPVSFEGITGTVSESIARHSEELSKTKQQLQNQVDKAVLLAKDLLKLEILHDHHANLLNREQTRGTAPATEQTVILEGWVKEDDLRQLEKVVSKFAASSLSRIEPAENEQMPVEIENTNLVRPFEVITRLYGMPDPNNVDPTPFLAPFFALFFGICLTDVGYGLLLSVILWLIMRKFQGDKKAFYMLLMCAAMSIIAGAVTGGWFSDAIQTVLPQGNIISDKLNAIRNKLMLFDPMKRPMVFFAISLILGYTQVQFGLLISFLHRMSKKQYLNAVFDPLAWIIFLNSLVLFILSKLALIPKPLSGLFAALAILMALIIMFLSVRAGGWGARIGMGAFQLFSTVFYFGDVLSYVRLMALGMVTGGLGIAINILVRLIMDKGVSGYLIGAGLFVGAHIFNLAVSMLSAFVHTLRLQYVEFFPKFLEGGGEPFKPLQIENKYVYIEV